MTNPPDHIDELLRAVGRLEAGQESARDSRKIIREQLTEFSGSVKDMSEALQRTTFALQVTTDIAVQTRDSFSEFKNKFDADVQPAIDRLVTFKEDSEPIIESMRKVRQLLLILIAVIGFSGVSTIGVAAFANDYAKVIVREWLELEVPGIPPIN